MPQYDQRCFQKNILPFNHFAIYITWEEKAAGGPAPLLYETYFPFKWIKIGFPILCPYMLPQDAGFIIGSKGK